MASCPQRAKRVKPHATRCKRRMSVPRATSTPIISPRIFALILTSPRLSKQLVPEGLVTSPYRILDYHATLILEDSTGSVATFERTQRVQFQQDGVSAVMDHLWGDGVLTHYENTLGELTDTFKEDGRRHLVLGLPRPMARGEVVEFQVRRTAMASFTKSEEWLETTLVHPIMGLSPGIIFPKTRPCQQARLQVGDREVRLRVIALAGGRTLVRAEIAQPEAHTPYIIRWSW
jgi:hypothetical protein